MVVGVGVGTGGPPPGGGVPVAVPRLVYWPAVATRRGGEGPGLGRVEQAVAVGVAADEGGGEVVGRVGGRAVVVAHRDAGQRDVAGVGDDVGEGHRAADRDERAGAASLSVPLVSLTMLIAGAAPKWLSGLVSVTGGPPPGGVPVAVPTLVYWPAVAIRDAVKVQVSAGSSRPSPLASPPTKVGVEVVGRVGRRAVVVAHASRRTAARCRCW